MKKLLAILFLLAASAQAQTTVRYADRTIDLAPYAPANAILAYRALPGVRALFVRQRIDGAIRLRVLPFDGDSAQDPFAHTDFAKQHAVPRLDTLTNTWIMRADTANDEHFDLFVAGEGRATMKRLTRGARVWNWWPQGGKIVYSHWVGSREPYSTCLSLLDMYSAASNTVLCSDSSTNIFPAVTWRQDGKAFAQLIRRSGQHVVAIFTLAGDSVIRKEHRLAISNANAQIIDWNRPERIRVSVEKDSARNLFDIDVVNATLTPVTRFTKRVQIAGAQQVGGRDIVLVRATLDGRVRLTAYSVPETRELGSVLLPPNTTPVPAGGSWLLEEQATDAPTRYALLQLRVESDSAVFITRGLPGQAEAPQACDSDTLSYKTHDGRTVKGFLRTPRRPLSNPEDRLAIVHAYYGGSDSYDELASLWCEAGIASLSSDIDRETKGDRGGNEVADVLVGARVLRDRLGLKERQIGVYGMSQGGYNAMRALTFQPETNNLNLAFDFGFGIAEAGYSSMVTIFENTNTESPDIIATGNPWTEEGRARLRERSPLDQVQRLNAPLLLIHGVNDYRVRIEESKQMHDAARAAGKDVRLIEMRGEGHGVAGRENLLRYYRAQLEFLARVALIRGGTRG